MKSYPIIQKPTSQKIQTSQRKSQSKVSLQDNRKSSQTGLVQMANQGKQALQLKALEGLFNSSQAIQKQSIEEEELLQGKFETAQREGIEDEELLQGKFEPIQKQGLEEEDLMQGKFKTIQKMDLEEEEPLQGKFETLQKQGLEEEELMQGKLKTIQKMDVEEEEPLQGKFIPVQRQGIEVEELLQGKFEPLQKKENNTGLPDNLKSGIESLSGYSMNDVKVNYNSDKPAQLQAHAYAQGTDIHLASGQEKHLPHEAWHVVQQKQGRVKPTLQMKGNLNVNDDAGLENEADVMGSKALSSFQNNIGFFEKTNFEVKLNPIVQKYTGALASFPNNPLAMDLGYDDIQPNAEKTTSREWVITNQIIEETRPKDHCVGLDEIRLNLLVYNMYKAGINSDFESKRNLIMQLARIGIVGEQWRSPGVCQDTVLIGLQKGAIEFSSRSFGSTIEWNHFIPSNGNNRDNIYDPSWKQFFNPSDTAMYPAILKTTTAAFSTWILSQNEIEQYLIFLGKKKKEIGSGTLFYNYEDGGGWGTLDEEGKFIKKEQPADEKAWGEISKNSRAKSKKPKRGFFSKKK